MSYSKTAKLQGSNMSYQVNEQCKKFTLRDYGFSTTKTGNFLFEATITPSFDDPREVNLKVTIDKELSDLSLNVTNKKGLQAIDIYKNEAMMPFAKQVDYIFGDMIERQILTEAE